ncbi:MAG TPA: CHC2 zinc finger domain-containing protein [Lacipirellulaceae bacterium]|nr:CHC2 zinc finger domain-containing protein [Lacipirellulaceae bacterium]
MSFGPGFDTKEQVRQAIDIVELVGSYVQLRRQGRNFVGLCPWHDDSRPSLQVNPERQSFKCWVCDIGGDVFSFVMKAEGLEFREALEMLAERAGVSLQRSRHHPSEPGGGHHREAMVAPRHGYEQVQSPGSSTTRLADPAEEKRTLYGAAAWAEEQFHRCLATAPEAAPGRQYLAERGITVESVRQFHLGFAPDRWDWILGQARGTPWTPAILERIGLLRRKELGGGHYDWFRGRVMFSIRDARSRPIAFGGRVLPQLADDHTAKYINSPETPLFSKSRELYGLDMARESFKKAGGAIVMEGYTDCLMAHQHGIDNCVAVLGTALGERHLQLLRRYTDSITLVLDGDEAGRRRTNEILDALLALFEKNSVDLRILTLPQGVDPCDFIATHGSDSFRRLLAQAVDALEHKFNAVTNGLDTLTDTHRASQAAEQMLATLAQIRPAGGGASSETLLREEQMLGRIARKFHLPEEQLRNRLTALRRDARTRQSAKESAVRPAASSAGRFQVSGGGYPTPDNYPRLADLPAWDRDLLELLLLEPHFINRLAEVVEPITLTSPAARFIYETCCRLVDSGQPCDFNRLMTEFDDPGLKNLLVSLDESCAIKESADRERWLADLLETYHRRKDESQRRLALAAARENSSDAEQLLARFCEQSKSKHLGDYERRKK